MTRSPLPPRFAQWFSARGWTPRAHQLAMIAAAQAGESALLIAPTGAGKTLAGFLPSLAELAEPRRRNAPGRRLHTLYVSPLKALAADVHRNLQTPIEEMGLPIRAETRTGDTPAQKRLRQRRHPPDILMTTPEQAALLLGGPDAAHLFADLRCVIFDELHALAPNKRGDLMCLGLARLRALSPGLRAVGLSATVREPDELRRWLAADDAGAPRLVTAPAGAAPDLAILPTLAPPPWAGHSARHALPEIYRAIEGARMALIFVNTRAQAEYLFQALWRINEAGLPIALHHGSLDAAQRRKVEGAMVRGELRAVVCTSTLDLGIDWGDVDLVVNVGAPKGASRLAQRVGRANHRWDEASRARLVPANRFELLECVAAMEAARAGEQDAPAARPGALDILCQHILGVACAGPFDADALFAEVRGAAPYRDLSRDDFDRSVQFVADGGYALKAYERYAKIRRGADGLWRLVHPGFAQQWRLNVGAIVEAAMLKVRLTGGGKSRADGRPAPGGRAWGGRILGEVEEYFLETLVPGDTFLFAGEILALVGIVENEALVRRAAAEAPKIPSYDGGKFPLSTWLAARVRALLADRRRWKELPDDVREWLELQKAFSQLPKRDGLLVETFPRAGKFYLAAYAFEGRLAHQTLGMLLTRRMERAGLRPLGFVANDYALAVWSLDDPASGDMDALFAQDMLGDDLDAWLATSALMKRTFRNCALISGLVERRAPGREKTGRQTLVSTDLIYDTLLRHQPDHILMEAARADAASGLLDVARLAGLLARVRGRIDHRKLSRVSPLAVPLLLEIGVEPVYGEGRDAALAAASAELEREIGL